MPTPPFWQINSKPCRLLWPLSFLHIPDPIHHQQSLWALPWKYILIFLISCYSLRLEPSPRHYHFSSVNLTESPSHSPLPTVLLRDSSPRDLVKVSVRPCHFPDQNCRLTLNESPHQALHSQVSCIFSKPASNSLPWAHPDCIGFKQGVRTACIVCPKPSLPAVYFLSSVSGWAAIGLWVTCQILRKCASP